MTGAEYSKGPMALQSTPLALDRRPMRTAVSQA
jgi:hypothetical protein